MHDALHGLTLGHGRHSEHGQSAYASIEQRYEALLAREKAWLAQCRDRQLCNKKKGYKNLLAMLAGEKWTDSLRSYD
jgi:hypothetical protein